MQVRGVRPFFSEKYDITRHPRYKYLSDADKKNYFDVDRYLTALRRKRQRGVSQEETFDLYDIDLSDEDTRTLYDEDGYPHLCVDEYMKRCLEIRLIQAIVKV